jgi:hypothetical protein
MGSLQKPHWWCGNAYMDDDAPRLNNSLTMPHKTQSLNLVCIMKLLAKESTLVYETIWRGLEVIEVN